ncbi:MAG: uracil-DNA glycosylase [Chloroflexaceae bacterium]|nr:uracil-DNA glycosylase [Chloroflexaceae bacterium]
MTTSFRFPNTWHDILGEELAKPYMLQLQDFLTEERSNYTIYPPKRQVFTALELTPYDQVRVLILGQDPYHGPSQAHGLCFSVLPGVPAPPSLVNIFKELHDDVGCFVPNNGYLVPWAEQGILLLNAVLTVRAGQANAHKDKGWEVFTDRVIQAVSARAAPVVFVLWGNYARKKVKLIDTTRHTIVQSAHPSPLSARNGFFGSRPFSAINRILEQHGSTPIDWQIPHL